MKKNYYAASKYWQCSECSKWRYVGKEPCTDWNPDTWTCRHNPYQPQNRCEERDAFEDIGVPVYLKTKQGEKIQGSIIKLNVPKEEASEGKYPFFAISCSCQRCTTKFCALPDNMWQGIRWYQDHCSKDKSQRWTNLVTYVRFDGTSGPIAEWLKFNAEKWGMTHNSKCIMSGTTATKLPRIKTVNDNTLPLPQAAEESPTQLLPTGVRIASINDPSLLNKGMRTVKTPLARNNNDSLKDKRDGFGKQRSADCNMQYSNEERPLKRHKTKSVRDLEHSIANYKNGEDACTLNLVNAGDPSSQIEVIQAQYDILNNTTQLQSEAISRTETQLRELDAQISENEHQIQSVQHHLSSLQHSYQTLLDQKKSVQSLHGHLLQHKSILKDTIHVMQTQLTTLEKQINSDSSPPQSTLQAGIQINTQTLPQQQPQPQQQQQQQSQQQQQQPQTQQQFVTLQCMGMEVDQESQGNLQQNSSNQNSLQNEDPGLVSQQQQKQDQSGVKEEKEARLRNGVSDDQQRGDLLHGIGSLLLVTMLMDSARGVDFKDEKSCCRTILSPLLLHGLLQ